MSQAWGCLGDPRAHPSFLLKAHLSPCLSWHHTLPSTMFLSISQLGPDWKKAKNHLHLALEYVFVFILEALGIQATSG